MERNDELIDKVMAYICEHPEEWDQREWYSQGVCGTTACFAGHAMLLSGYSIIAEPVRCRLPGACLEHVENRFVRPDGTLVSFNDLEAATLLGLSQSTAERIFFGGFSLGGLKAIIDDIRKRG